MKENRDRTWTKVTKVTPDITSYCVQKLKTKAEYVFRVMAVNEVGVSEPLTSDIVIPQSPYGKYITLQETNILLDQVDKGFLYGFISFF